MSKIKKLIEVFVLMMVLVFSLPAAGEGENLLRNGGFEELTKKGGPKYWLPWPHERVSLSKDVKWAGSHAICITRDDNKGRTNFVQYFAPGTFEPDTTYRLTCYIKTKDIVPDTTNKWFPNATGAGFQIYVKGEKKTMNYFCPRPLFVGTMSWSPQGFTFTTPKGTSEKSPYLRVVLNYASGTVWFDDIRLEKIGPTPVNF